MNTVEVEELLIRAVHSDKNADQYILSKLNDFHLFYTILDIVENSVSGDARMKGAYYLSKFCEELLKNEEERLLTLMDDEWNSVSIHIMVALSRIKSLKAFDKIINRIEPVLYWEAQSLKNYSDLIYEKI